MLWLAVELGVVIGRKGRDIKAADAESYIAGYGLHRLELDARHYVLTAGYSIGDRHDGSQCSGGSQEEGSSVLRHATFKS